MVMVVMVPGRASARRLILFSPVAHDAVHKTPLDWNGCMCTNEHVSAWHTYALTQTDRQVGR